MKGFVKTLWFKILAVIMGILIIFLILAAVLGSKSSPLSATAGTVTQPLSRVTSVLGNGFSNIGQFFTRSSTYEKRIEDLEGKVISAQKQLADYEETKQKLESYENFLGIKEQHPDYQVISATVIGKDSANNFTTFVFNKGAVSGVKVDDPVIYGDGQLVGVVTKVAPTYCVVSTILDPNISISAYEVRTRESGYITNDADIVKKGFCRLSGLDRKTKVSKGSVIATAGVGGIYPRDLIIGTVREIQNDEKDISAYAVIEPNIDVTQMTEALIMTGFEGQGIAATYDDGAEGADADSPEVQSNPNRTTTDTAASTESTTAGETTSSTTARRTTTTRPVTTFRTTGGRATTEASE
ncbi:MAG: rod shape-determining protein MreC [Clostridia bacterium]|nr:rod shape-determining protein MreC [Clostridia bacterium]MBQ3327034.1 rod shape-determining protein MreC [Clostridia bacterium]MBQ4460101.1 rod shape-determining protein MreC [Clostridia bacterium]MBQ6445638.1 rod shape-determining protein MreC [Clostridia bacterium]MBR0363746.1 rod shape-determining protein MreC [Clostridia bacterium]